MLDPQTRFTLPDVPDVWLYADDREKYGFYAIAQSPRIAVDDSGAIQLSLTLYGRREPSGFKATGGLCSLTTTLALTPTEEKSVRAGLARRLAQQDEEHAAPGDPKSPPQLLGIVWLQSDVEVKLFGDFKLTGTPSLVGANQCALNTNLRAADANALWKAWEGGLPDATITYRVQVRAAPPSGVSMEFTSTTERVRTDENVREHAAFDFRHVATVSAPYALTLAGPIRVPSNVLAARAKTIAL